MTAAVLPASTTGILGLWDGTDDGKDGYIDYATGKTNVNRPKDFQIEVHNIRRFEEQPTLINNGYQLVSIPSVISTEQFLVSNKTPEGKAFIEDAYFKECKRVIEEVTGGAGEIIPVSFRLREQTGAKKSTSEKLGSVEARYAPRPVAHLDRDEPTAITVVEDAVGKEEAQKLLQKYKRWAQVNVWRPIGNPASMWPLCFINHDRIPDWTYDSHVGHVWSLNDPRVADRGQKSYDCVVKHDERYDYHYVSDLKPEECLVFCSFDSISKYAIPHSAFWDDNVAEDAPDRKSIEVRSLVFF
ncbi:hypothetical protein DOTSEDRAFT_156415 [Dothistroma septosporum NZE10]|uniref:Uncharacterized protein n=1 Tax=Dothistroma septosporum (strain NZE10 / CBS 128990) TaxID=675120 RepID=N1PH89_DOTSN|nr:hypothetical protein DOTSEDRAFT_156415 [Dothistroma septosporum NZE10]